jgi:hypothetical protein
MRNLLSAGTKRLWKDKVFWTLLGCALFASVAMVLVGVLQNESNKAAGIIKTLDNFYFVLAPGIGLFCAIFTSLFLGTEYGEGTMRNKITVGHTRVQIYLANFVTCFVAGLCFVAAWLVGGLVGAPFLGLWTAGAGLVIANMLVAVFLVAVWAGIFTIVAMLMTNKAIMAVVCLLLAIALLVVSSMFLNALLEPEFNNSVAISANATQMGEPVPNPYYVTGTTREVLQFLTESLPGGQSLLVAALQISRPLLSLSSSVIIAVATILIGLFAFRRKDLK